MGRDGRYTAVVDRFEADRAVLLLEADGDVVDERLVDREDLPADARRQDAVLELRLESGDVSEIRYLADETRDRTERAQDRFERLSSRPPDPEQAGPDPESKSGSPRQVDDRELSDEGSDADRDAASGESDSSNENAG